jgi:hypothetical protein
MEEKEGWLFFSVWFLKISTQSMEFSENLKTNTSKPVSLKVSKLSSFKGRGNGHLCFNKTRSISMISRGDPYPQSKHANHTHNCDRITHLLTALTILREQRNIQLK